MATAWTRCRAYVREHALVYARGVTVGIEAMFALLDGRLSDAEERIEQSVADARARGSVGLLAQAVGQRFWLARERGRLAELAPMVEAVRARLPRLLLATAALALGYALNGAIGPGLGALEAVMNGLSSAPFDLNRVPSVVYAAEAAFLLRAPAAAAALERELAPYTELGVANQNASLYYGAVAQSLGWLAAARGRSAEALPHFRKALEIHTALRSPPWIERSRRAITEVRSSRHLRAI